MEQIKKNCIPVLLAMLHWSLITFLYLDKAFFSYDYLTSYYIATKVILFGALIVAWCFAFHCIKQIKNKNEVYVRGLKVFAVHFSISMVLLLILWPGTWSWDDLWTLYTIRDYNSWHCWQHVITGIYQDVLLQILPFPGGIIFIQNIIISLCVSFVVVAVEEYLQKKSLLFIAPFLLPPILMYQFSGYRIGLYIFLEIAMMAMLLRQKKWSASYTLLFAALCVIVSSWRSESFLYLLLAIGVLFFSARNVISARLKVVAIITMVVCFVGLSSIQSISLGNKNYLICSLIRPCTEVVRVTDESDPLLQDIDRVIRLEAIYSHPEADGERLYFDYAAVREDYSDADYKAFMNGFIRLSLNHPGTVFMERWNIFLKSSGVTLDATTNVDRSMHLFDLGNDNDAYNAAAERELLLFTPMSAGLRKGTINILGCGYSNIVKFIVWNSVLPILILIGIWIAAIVKKNKFWIVLLTVILLRGPIVFLSEPSGWFMYFMSFYLLGYFMLWSLIVSRKKASNG